MDIMTSVDSCPLGNMAYEHRSFLSVFFPGDGESPTTEMIRYLETQPLVKSCELRPDRSRQSITFGNPVDICANDVQEPRW